MLICLQLFVRNKMQAQTEPNQKQPNKKNLLIGITGSVAIIKLPQLVALLAPHFNIKVLATKHSLHFLNSQQYKLEYQKHLHSEPPLQIYQDNKQWQMWEKRGDPVLHITEKVSRCNAYSATGSQHPCQAIQWSMRQFGHFSLQSLANAKGIKWNYINQTDYCMPFHEQLNVVTSEILKKWGYEILGPVSKKMMCGDVGNGAMSEVQDIAKYMTDQLSISKLRV